MWWVVHWLWRYFVKKYAVNIIDNMAIYGKMLLMDKWVQAFSDVSDPTPLI